MVSSIKRRLRTFRRVFGYGVLVLVILLAVLVGLFNQALPWVATHPKQIQDWLSQRIGEPVNFSKAKGEWTRRGPVFTLDDLQVGSGEQTLKVGRANLLIAVYSGLMPGSPLTELKVDQLALQLEQDQDLRWSLKGLPGQVDPNVDPLEKLEGFGELQIEKAALSIKAPRYQMDVKIPRVDLRLRVSEEKIKVGMSAWADTQSAPLNAVFDVARANYDGTAWIGGEALQMRDWSSLLKATGLSLQNGQGEANVWATLKERRITRLQMTANLNNVNLLSSKLITLDKAKTISPDARFDRVDINAQWAESKSGWQFIAPRMQFHRNNKIATLDGLEIAGGQQIILRAPNIDLQPAFALLSLSDFMPEKLREWMVQASPNAQLSKVDLRGSRDGPWVGSMQISNLQIEPVGVRPGVRGLNARLQMDGQGGALFLDSKPLTFSWPGNFKQDINLSLDGNLVFWRDAELWTLGTSKLTARGPDIGFTTRFNLDFQGDGSAPNLDLAMDLDDSNFQQAKKFWFLRTMSPNAVKWLNTALIKGDVLNSRIVINGDLDDFPFRNKEGVFDARASVRNAHVKFNPLWPQAEPLDVDVVFDGKGFSLSGTGGIENNRVTQVTGGIEDFKRPILDLDIECKTQAENLRALILKSPLQKKYAEHLNAGSVKGNASVVMNLVLPMREDLPPGTMSGTLELQNANLSDSRWDIAFTGVTGKTQFTQAGFKTNDLKVNFEKRPAIFNLSVGSFLPNPQLAALVSLEGSINSEALVSRYDNVKWLKPYVSGVSEWLVKVAIPQTGKGPSAAPELNLSSNLVGTAISLPAPLNKTGAQAIPLQFSTALPMEKGQLQVRFGNIMHMRASQKPNQPMNAHIQFGGDAPLTLPASGLVAKGNVNVFDSGGWMAFATSGESASSLNEVNLRANKLIFLDQPYTNATFVLSKNLGATQMRVEGDDIQGQVNIAAAQGSPILGRFTKLYLNAANAAVASSSSSSSSSVPSPAPVSAIQANSNDASMNPAKIPSIRFTIDDLRIGKTIMGSADIATTQLSNGMRIDRFQTKSKYLSVDANGDWLLSGTGSRSNFKINFSTSSLGDLLNDLGFVGLIKGGKSKANLTASWPGSPGALAMANISGDLRIDVGEGRLLDVEPGGSGRILGLISLAEIPRRLSLDFSDFFSKGFAFNEMKGNIVFTNGTASTDNLRINGPAAEIKVVGSANVREQTYDQKIEVLPKAGGILPALGFITGGPAGAAMGAAAQAVLQKPLKQTARTVYHVTGPWKKPEVVVVEKGPAKGTANRNQNAEVLKPKTLPEDIPSK
jgi:uncharacterized protein (TIGR02099 family)